jgi:hypothetical protein
MGTKYLPSIPERRFPQWACTRPKMTSGIAVASDDSQAGFDHFLHSESFYVTRGVAN